MVESETQDPSERLGRRGVVPVLLVVITLVGAVVRSTGLTSAGLFYDDAWFALPARVDMGTALKMVVTTPGYTMLQSAWISLGPAGNTWPKVLPFILGALAAPAGYWLSRRLALPRWAALVAAGLLAAAPAAIEYSVRVKEYEADLLLGVVVLAVLETARRRRSVTSIVTLGVVSVLSVGMSSSLIVVVVGSWLALLASVVIDRRGRPAVVMTGAVTAVCCGLQALWISSHIPDRLTKFWVDTDRLVGKPFTTPHLLHTASLTPGGLAHGFLGTPLPTGQFPMTWQISHFAEIAMLVLGVIEVVLLVVLVRPSIAAAIGRRSEDPALALLAPSLTLVVAVLLWLVGIVPLGTGRTDLVLYPAIAVLVAAGLARMARLVTTRTELGPSSRRAVALALACVAAIGATGLAWHQRSWYPAQNLDQLRQRMGARLHPDDIEVVAGRNTFTWAFQGDSPFVVHVDRNDVRARTVGFWVTFTTPRVLEVQPTKLTLNPLGATTIPGLTQLPPSAHRLWVFATSNLVLSPSAYKIAGPTARAMTPIGVDPILRRAGWHQMHGRVHAAGVVAVLYTR